eukprot:TRINITY_DN4015_c0_g3_i1.p1 TRINITY_DN4015_c0_g3~~TRINITY_DN4015_c0_g3_i1.p1  ORF type:complete len:361 (-),score=104.20 TRINITY_DN4015_c0_g3_i1:156-1238(-)
MEKSEMNEMKILLSQPYFIVGEHIKGKVQINIAKNYSIHKLDIRFIGKEKLVVYGKKLSREIIDTTSILEENKTDPELRTYIPKILSPGTYEYPFIFSSIFQGHKTPSTNTYRSFTMNFKTKYTLKAYVTTFGATEKNLKAKCQVELLEPLKSEHELEKYFDLDVKGLVFISGSTGIHTWIDHSGFVLPAGMSIRVICFNNKCTKGIDRIVVRLVQEAKTTFPVDTKPLVETDVVGEWILEGARAHNDVTIKKRLMIDSLKNAMELESCTGSFFEKTYSLTITPIYNMWICKQKPSVTYNLRVTKRPRGKEKSLEMVVNRPGKEVSRSFSNAEGGKDVLELEGKNSVSFSQPLLGLDEKQ